MKKIRLIQATLVLLLASASGIAQNNPKEAIHIKSARFVTPLVEKWASEYKKVNPEVEITVLSDPSDKDVDLEFIGWANEKDTKHSNQAVAFTGRYALLPITNAANPLLKELSKKRLNNKRLEEFFFEKNLLDDYPDPSKKQKHEVTIYSGNNVNSTAGLLASHFGYTAADIRGKKISGDDIYLINAVLKDNTSAAFNHLSYIFDIETRGLKRGLALLPLDVKKGQHEILEAADIDKTIALLESETIPLIPVEHMGFSYQNDNFQAKEFLNWILVEGQKYNQEYGFLKIEADVLSAQLKEIEVSRYTASY